MAGGFRGTRRDNGLREGPKSTGSVSDWAAFGDDAEIVRIFRPDSGRNGRVLVRCLDDIRIFTQPPWHAGANAAPVGA